MNKRQSKIIEYLNENNGVSVNNLAVFFDVSTVTIRQDLNKLESLGFIKRLHGRAVINESDNVYHRLCVNYSKKVKIALRACSLIEDGETIFLESGSTNSLLAREVAKRREVSVITPNAFIARQIREINNPDQGDVILIGGYYQKESESVVGSLSRLCLDHLNFVKSFIGVDGFSPDVGFTSRDMMRAELASWIISKSQELIVLCDSTKFYKKDLVHICNLSDVDYLVTDDGLSSEVQDYLLSQDVNLCLSS